MFQVLKLVLVLGLEVLDLDKVVVVGVVGVEVEVGGEHLQAELGVLVVEVDDEGLGCDGERVDQLEAAVLLQVPEHPGLGGQFAVELEVVEHFLHVLLLVEVVPLRTLLPPKMRDPRRDTLLPVSTVLHHCPHHLCVVPCSNRKVELQLWKVWVPSCPAGGEHRL